MKKMMTFAAAMLIAVASQAMSINWSTTIVDDLGGAANPLSGFTVTLFVAGSPESSGVTDVTGLVGASLIFQSSGFGSGLDIPTGTAMYFTLAGTTGGNNYTMTTSTFNMPVWTSPTDTAAGSALDLAWQTSLDGTAGALDLTNVGWTVTPVPEPTSMALLALGAAALGLRRRFKV